MSEIDSVDLGRALLAIEANAITLQEASRLKPFEHWVGHIPFAFWLIDKIRPGIFVEIGTHRGNSFLAFCQAIQTVSSGTRAYAVDTWEGDAHMAREEGLFEELSSYHDPRYGHFSSLVRATFEEARELFADGSVDLLHIDGTHTYEAVKRDFETWQSALSSRAVVLFHDTNVRRPDYGVWKLWCELAESRPHFEFYHSYGLGVLGVGTDFPEPLRNLFFMQNEKRPADLVRGFFAARGSVGINRLKGEVQAEQADRAATLHQTEVGALKGLLVEAEAVRVRQDEAHLMKYQQALESWAGERADFERAVADALRQCSEASNRVAELGSENQRLANQSQKLGEIRSQESDHFAKRSAETSRELLDLRGKLAALQATLEMTKRVGAENVRAVAHTNRLTQVELDHVRRAVQAAQAELSGLRESIVQKDAELRALYASTSWKLSAPLRSVVETVLPHKRTPRRQVLLAPDQAPVSLPAIIHQTSSTLGAAAPPTLPEVESHDHSSLEAPALVPEIRTPRWEIKMPDLFRLRGFQPSGRIAVVIHVYYPEVAGELLSALGEIEEPFDLFMSLVEGHSEFLEADISRRFSEIANLYVSEPRPRYPALLGDG